MFETSATALCGTTGANTTTDNTIIMIHILIYILLYIKNNTETKNNVQYVLGSSTSDFSSVWTIPRTVYFLAYWLTMSRPAGVAPLEALAF